MHMIDCPRCGKPGPLSQQDYFTCGSCRFAGPIDPELSEKLRRVGDLVGEHDAREQQLSRFQQRMVNSTAFAATVYLGSLGSIVLPLGCCLTFVQVTQSGPMNWVLLLMGAMPIVTITVVGTLGYLFMRTRLILVRELTAMVPPAKPGAPARCHVCGGDVVPEGGQAYTRCSYCGTDNLTDPATIASLTSRRDRVLDAHEDKTVEHLRLAKRTFRTAMASLLVGAVLAGPLSFVCVLPVWMILDGIDAEPYGTLQYTVVDSPQGRCFAAVTPHFEPELVRVRARWGDSERLNVERSTLSVPTFGYESLIGLRVQEAGDGHREMSVTAVVGTLGTVTNMALLRADDGFEARVSTVELCLAPTSESPVEPIPMVPEPEPR